MTNTLRTGKVIIVAIFTFVLFVGFFGFDANRDGIVYGDNVKSVSYILKNNRVVVKKKGVRIWISPRFWNVRQILKDDIDGDGIHELMMVLIKKGRFGGVAPFWHDAEIVKRDKNKIGCHLFVYVLRGKKFIPVWCSSTLPRTISGIKTKKSLDGKCTVLITEEIIEKSQRNGKKTIKKYETGKWFWNKWGFTKERD